MVQYIKKLVQGIIKRAKDGETAYIPSFILALLEELNRLDPRDFLPDAQDTFVFWRAEARGRFKHDEPTIREGFNDPKQQLYLVDFISRINEILDKYSGEGSRAETRSFGFVKDKCLRDIIERDYKELSR
jgi:hypothetical protein